MEVRSQEQLVVWQRQQHLQCHHLPCHYMQHVQKWVLKHFHCIWRELPQLLPLIWSLLLLLLLLLVVVLLFLLLQQLPLLLLGLLKHQPPQWTPVCRHISCKHIQQCWWTRCSHTAAG